MTNRTIDRDGSERTKRWVWDGQHILGFGVIQLLKRIFHTKGNVIDKNLDSSDIQDFDIFGDEANLREKNA